MTSLVPFMPEIIEANSLEAVILSCNVEYCELKHLAEKWGVEAKARWFSIGEKEYEENLRLLSKRKADEEDESGVLPPLDFYQEELAPLILQLVSGDVQEFKHVGDLSLRVIKAMYEVYVPQAGSKRFIIPTFFDQYFDFLHAEDDSTVLAVARMQASRANMHAEEEMQNVSSFNDYPLKSCAIKQLLGLFKGTVHQNYRADFLALCGGIDNGHVLDTFLQSLPNVLDRLEGENNETVQRYLAFAKAEGFPNDMAAFKFQDPACVDDVKIFDKLEGNKERAVELYRLLLEKNLIQFMLGDEAKDLVPRIQELEHSRFHDDVPRLLQDAIELTHLGISGARYLVSIREVMTNTGSNTRVYLEMIRDLAALSPEAARSYFWCHGKEFTLPVVLREKYHRAGMAVAREFGKNFTDYFENALRVLKERPDRFEFWLERVAELGRRKPALLNKLDYFSTVAVRDGNLDEMLAVVSYFDDRLHAYISTFDERVIGVDRDADFISEYHEAKKLRVNPRKLVETTLRLIETSDLYRPAHSILFAVKNGVDFDKYVEILPLLKKRHLDDVPLERLREFINSDYNFLQKEELLTAYALFIHDQREWGRLNREKCPVLDPQGEWTNQLAEKLIAETSQYFNFDTSKFDVPDLMLLARIAQEEFPHRGMDVRMRYLLEQRAAGKFIPKNMEGGKAYETLGVEQGEGRHFDSLQIRTARGELPDIVDTLRLLSHAFYPHGHQKKASLNYVLHPDVSLMHIVPKIGTEEGAPIGVVVSVQARERRNGTKYFLVDSVTYGPLLEAYNREIWVPQMHESILHCARDAGAQILLYNTSVSIGNGDSAEKFLSYLHNTFGGEHHEVQLQVARSPILEGLVEKQREELRCLDSSEGRGLYGPRTSFETRERVNALQHMMAHYTGLHLRAWGREHSMMADNVDGPGALAGFVKGLAFPVKE